MALNSINANALSTGLDNFVDTYLKAKQMKQQNDLAQQGQQIQLATSGLIKDPETGLIQPSPLAAAQKQEAMQDYAKQGPLHDSLLSASQRQAKMVDPNSMGPDAGLTNKELKEYMAATKPELSGAYMVNSRGQLADVGKERNQIMRDQGEQRIGLQGQSLGLRTGKVANDINKQVMGDPVVKATDMQQNSISKGLQQLSSTEKPITNQMLNEIQNDYANAVTGGRQAAQGTIHDQQMQTLQAKAANLKQYITGAPTEAATPAQVQYFKTAFNELRGLNQQIRQSRVQSLTGGATAAYGNQGAFGNVIGNLNENANGQGLIPNPQEAPAPGGAMSRADKEAMARKLMGQ